MSERVRCSWILPVRNGGPWLADAVESALAASGPQDEVLVVDDGSDDGAPHQLPSHDPRVRVLHQSPLGIVPALERGRAEARGLYLARLDADDRARPERLAAQLAALESRADVVLMGGRAQLFCDDGPVTDGMQRYVDRINGLTHWHRELLVECPVFHPACTFRSDAVAAVGGYRDGPFPEDYDLVLRLARHGGRIAAVPQVVVDLRDHPARLTRNDPRYSHAAFDEVRREHLRATVLQEPRRIVLWAGRRGGRAWLRWFQSSGHTVVAVVDLVAPGLRRGVPVIPPGELQNLAFDALFVVVGSWGARETIRGAVETLRPDLVEGETWFALR